MSANGTWPDNVLGAPSLHFASKLEGSGRGRYPMRFEDLTQDGRAVLEPLTTALMGTYWGDAFVAHPMMKPCVAEGVIPVLTRFVIANGDGPFGIVAPVESDGVYLLAHSKQPDGEVARIHLLMWCNLHAPHARTLPGGTVPGEGQGMVGRFHAEYTFTRLLAKPGERRVTALPKMESLPSVPTAVHEPHSPEVYTAPSEGFRPAAEAVVLPFTFGLRHTDANRHVNSLQSIRICEEASLHAMALAGLDAKLLARAVDVEYVRPCFAGETVERLVQLCVRPKSELDEMAVETLCEIKGADGKTRTRLRFRFSA